MSNENLKKSTIGASKIVARPTGGVQRGAYSATVALGGAREKEASYALADSNPDSAPQETEQPTRGTQNTVLFVTQL
jgi:hypothetical protein